MVPGRFIGEEVEVKAGDFGRPLGFVWRGRNFELVEILRSWRKLDLGRAWRRRRHRDHHLVRTDARRVFELYFHRGPGRRFWVLLRELDPAA